VKLPKTFRPEKNLDKKTGQLIEEAEYNSAKVNYMLDICEEFIFEVKASNLRLKRAYSLGKRLAPDFDYNKKDLEAMVKQIKIKDDKDIFLGIFVSALWNRINSSNDKILLKPSCKLMGLGFYLDKSLVTIEGDVGEYLGYNLRGGKIVVKGNVGSYTGYLMNYGEIIIKGNSDVGLGYGINRGRIILEKDADGWVGDNMKGGEIIVKGNAGRCPGRFLRDGKIEIFGNAGESTGFKMTGGKIIVHGDIEEIGEMFGGEIYKGNNRIRTKMPVK